MGELQFLGNHPFENGNGVDFSSQGSASSTGNKHFRQISEETYTKRAIINSIEDQEVRQE
jgi:hypothetical protein